MLRDFYSACLATGCIPDQWRSSILVPIEKEKKGVLLCGRSSYYWG